MSKLAAVAKSIFHDWKGYLFAIGLVALATWLKYLAQPNIIPANVPILYILAIVPTAIFFGFGPSIAVCLLSLLAYDYFYIPPLHEINLDQILNAPIIIIFLTVGILISFLSSNLRKKNLIVNQELASRKKSEAELSEYRDHLEDLVKQRTSELEQANQHLREEIAERQQTEEKLSQAVQRLNAHMDNSPLAVIEFDAAFRVIRWSKEAERVFGWTRVEVLGKSLSQMKWVFEEDIAQVNRVSDDFVSGETPRTLNVNRNYRKDGSVITCEWYNSAIYNSDGKMVSVLALVNDITQRQLAEESLKRYARELEEANKELESFSYSVSHDLRAPLRTLNGFSEMVLEDCAGKLDEQDRDYLNRIRNASQLMSQLIDDILRLSRIGRAEMICFDVDLSGTAQSIVDELKSSAPERKLIVTIQPGLKTYGDQALLKIMLQNLLENAWKYTGKKEQAEIIFGCRDYNEEETFFVQDNGAGFNMKFADKLFQPFQRMHAKEEYGGTGIGLAIVQRIIRRHGGRIWAEAEVGKGATFFFTIPQQASTYFYHE